MNMQKPKKKAMEQLKELNDSLDKLATQAAISQAFKTPEVIRLFGKREPKQLRERLSTIEQDLKLNKLNTEARDRQKAEILTALRQLNEQLTREELQFLEKHNDISNAFKNVEFVAVKDD
ncbi:hypothetical protein NQ314_003951 [Rhamnusium bicolor]|uniref:Beta-catenin-interacting ICAT domain-containing protein n=1 Tax=Rhamnusium bicolor TaxID=1586634 RepID=A0AAV8ZN66_9CUCU|nr:hypothetical protein NQ314_003951 [Rhamnusium bicolor]